jgi:hypothetical protein
LYHSAQEATNGTKGWEVALVFAASRRAIIENSGIQNFFSSNSSAVLTIEMMLAFSMCNAASLEMRGHNFEKTFQYLTQSEHEDLFPLLAGARAFPEAQPREWAASVASLKSL